MQHVGCNSDKTRQTHTDGNSRPKWSDCGCGTGTLQVGVSLVLSFMVVWDLPTIARGVQSLRSSRLRAIYMEVAPTFTVFGQLFGKALQAQVIQYVCTTS